MLLRTCVLLDLRKIILSYLSIDPSVVFLRSNFFWLWLLHLVFHLSLCKLGKAVGSKWNTEWAGLCIWPGSTRVHQAKEWRCNWGASGPSKFWHPKTQEVRRRQVHLTNILTVLKNNGGFEWAGSCIWPPSPSKFAHNTKRQKVWKYQLQFKVYNRVNFGWSKIINLIKIFCNGWFLRKAKIDRTQVGDFWIAALVLFLLLLKCDHNLVFLLPHQIVMVCQKVANFDCWIICGRFEGCFWSQFIKLVGPNDTRLKYFKKLSSKEQLRPWRNNGSCSFVMEMQLMPRVQKRKYIDALMNRLVPTDICNHSRCTRLIVIIEEKMESSVFISLIE